MRSIKRPKRPDWLIRFLRATLDDPCGVPTCTRPCDRFSCWCEIHTDAIAVAHYGMRNRPKELERLTKSGRLKDYFKLVNEVAEQIAAEDRLDDDSAPETDL